MVVEVCLEQMKAAGATLRKREDRDLECAGQGVPNHPNLSRFCHHREVSNAKLTYLDPVIVREFPVCVVTPKSAC